MNVENVMTRSPKTCSPADTMQRAAQLMWDHDFGCVPVVDGNGRLTGIVTDRDACMAGLMLGRALHEIPVGSVMSRQIFTLAPHDPVANALELFEEHNVRRVPVVDGRGQLVGILSIADVICACNENRIGKHTRPESVLSAVYALSKPRAEKSEKSQEPAEVSAKETPKDTLIPQARPAAKPAMPANAPAAKANTTKAGSTPSKAGPKNGKRR